MMVDDLTEKKVMCGVSVCKMDISRPDGILRKASLDAKVGASI